MSRSASPAPYDHVRLDRLPAGLESLPPDSQKVFRFCLGRVYRIDGIDPHGLLVLDVSGDIDSRFGGIGNEIHVEAACVSLVHPSGC